MPITRTVRRGARPVRRSILISAALSACAALSGCAAHSTAAPVSFPSAGLAPTFNLNPSPGASASAAAADAQSLAGAISVKVTQADSTVGTYPDGWATFTVVVANSSGTDVPNVLPLVVFGHCTCNPAAGGVAPHYQLQILDAVSGKWMSAAAVSTDASGVYAFERQTLVATLAAHQSLTYQYRVVLSGAKQGTLRNGTGDVDVYLMQQPGHVRITDTAGPDASFSLAYHVK